MTRTLPTLLVLVLIAAPAFAAPPARINNQTTIDQAGASMIDAQVDYLRAGTTWSPIIVANVSITTGKSAATGHAEAPIGFFPTLVANTSTTTGTLTATTTHAGTLDYSAATGSTLVNTGKVVGSDAYFQNGAFNASLTAGTGTFTGAVTTGDPKGSYSVIVYNSSGLYSARSNTGALIASGTNFTTLMESVSTDGASVFITPGEYLLTASPSGNNVTWQGTYGRTILRLPSATTANILTLYNVRGWTLRDLTFDGNGDNQTDGNNIEYHRNAIVIRTSNNITMDHIEIHDVWQNAIFALHDAAHLTLSRSHIHDSNTGFLNYNVGYGVTGNAATDILITGNQFTTVDKYASTPRPAVYFSGATANRGFITGNVFRSNNESFRADAAKEISIVANQMYGTTAADFWITNGASRIDIRDNWIKGGHVNGYSRCIYVQDSPGVSAVGNTISACGHRGLNFVTSDYCQIIGNRVNMSWLGGIHVESSNDCNVDGNYVRDSSQVSAGGASGVELKSALRTVVANNVLIDTQSTKTQQYGIFEESSTDYTVMLGNNVNTNRASTKILVLGSNDIIRSNIGYTTQNKGTGTVASGATTTSPSHGLSATPTRCSVTATNIPTNGAILLAVTTKGSSTFTVTASGDPGASGVTFDWFCEV